jgi:hypothetical protein
MPVRRSAPTWIAPATLCPPFRRPSSLSWQT